MPVRVRTAIALCLAALGCGGGGGGGTTGPAPIESISVTLAQSSIVIGDHTSGSATARDASSNVLSGRAMTWSSSNSGVATVDGTGVVTAVAAGTAGITASSEGKSGTANLTVTRVPVAKVTVYLPSSTVATGGTIQATAEVTDAQGAVLTGRAVSWSSSNEAVATVVGTAGVIAGLVTGVSSGTATITATSEGQSGSATVTVAAPVASVAVSVSSSTIGVGKTTQATATTKDAAGNVLSGRFVSWSSDNTSIATVSSAGLVTGVAVGSANIIATSEQKTGTTVITVAAPLGFGSSSEKIKIVDIGGVFTPTLAGPSSGTTTFVSRAPTVATVNSAGTITGVGEGQVWVAARAPGWAADSVYVIVPRTTTGPVLRTDLTNYNVTAGSTIVINVILDTRSTPIGGAEFSVGYTTAPPSIFSTGSYEATGTPAPIVANNQPGVLRASLASGNPLSGALSIIRLTFTARNTPASGFLTLTLIDLVSPTGTDLLPVSTSTRIPIIIQ
jgi:trimeric autotransporter adhesin